MEHFNTDDRSFSKLNFESLKDYDYILLTDLAISKELYVKFMLSNPNFLLIDHHLTGYQEIGPQDNYIYDNTKSGTKLFYEWITSTGGESYKIIEDFVELVDHYDMWKKSAPLFKGGKELNSILMSMRKGNSGSIESHSDFLSLQLDKFSKFLDKPFFFNNKEKFIILNDLKKERILFMKARKTFVLREDTQGIPYGYFESSSKCSIIASKFLELYPDIKYVALWDSFIKSNRKISLRSRDTFDCSAIALQYGGGGHAQASGFHYEDVDRFEQFRLGKIHLQ